MLAHVMISSVTKATPVLSYNSSPWAFVVLWSLILGHQTTYTVSL